MRPAPEDAQMRCKRIASPNQSGFAKKAFELFLHIVKIIFLLFSALFLSLLTDK
ncbi:MAG: hypothetical protein PWQ09_1717 [Candidatus Cloacimonadota bacterium]|nr:hypothetical protein [Candidatus Cloacimonadota bacterium]